MNKVNISGIQLYKHNKDTYQQMLEMFKAVKRLGVVQPTGTGKSYLFLKWIEDNQDEKIILLSPSTEIFRQAKEYVKNDAIFANVNMMTYQELIQKTEEQMQVMRVDKIILDEFHRIGAPLWGKAVQQLLDNNVDAQVLGLSATPIRYLDDAKDMAEKLFDGNMARYMTLGEAVHSKILPMPRYVTAWYDVDDMIDKYQKNIKALSNEKKKTISKQLIAKAKKYLDKSYSAKKIVEDYIINRNGKYIVFCKNIEHVETAKVLISQWFCEINVNMHFYTSVQGQSCHINELPEFKNDNDETAIKFLFTVDRLNEGVHVPGIDGVIMLRPTDSPIIYLQQMGRALASDNKEPVIFDMVNNYRNVRIRLNSGEYQNIFEKEFRKAAEDMKEMSTFEIFTQARNFNKIFDELKDILFFDRDDIWMENYELLKGFMLEFGREPTKSECYHNTQIGKWGYRQRSFNNQDRLREDRKKLLLDVGFSLDNKYDIAFESNLSILKEFIKKNGRVPEQREVYNGVKIGSWCSSLKTKYKNGILSQERIEKLVKIGFVLDNQLDVTFLNNLYILEEFIKEYGRMPKYQEVYKDIKIGNWYGYLKRQYNEGKLSQERIIQLTKIGFSFDKQSDEAFLTKLSILEKFIAEYKRIPTQKEFYKGINIGRWCSSVKEQYRNGKLPQERIEQLTKIGFSFNKQSDEAFLTKLRILEKFIAEYKRMPKQTETCEGINIGKWCNTIRVEYRNGKLSQVRIEQLTKVGFVFDNQFDAAFSTKLSVLEEFIKKYGRMPKSTEVYKGVNIGTWCNAIKSRYSNSKLSQERINQLTSVGFMFN